MNTVKQIKTVVLSLLISAAISVCALAQMSVEEAQAIVKNSLGKDIPFDMLPKDSNGKIVSIEKARATLKTQHNNARKTLLDTHFPPTTKNDPAMWVKVSDSKGQQYTVPNVDHPNYKQFVRQLDTARDKIDTDYQTKYGDKYKAFSEAVFGGADKDKVQLVGRAQNKIQSDIDATFKSKTDLEAMTVLMKKNGLTVEADPQGHGLYVKCPELDWLKWGPETVADLQKQYDDAPPGAEKKALGQRLSAAMKDVEVCATTAGAQHAIFNKGVQDPLGAKLDHLKKFSQTDDLYTKDKIVVKLIKSDLGKDGYEAYLADPKNRASKVLTEHGGETRALRIDHLPEALQADMRKQYLEVKTQELVESYRQSAVEHHAADEAKRRMQETLIKAAERNEQSGNTENANRLRSLAADIETERNLIKKTNNQAFREIAKSNPELGKKLLQTHAEVLVTLQKEKEDSRRNRTNGSAQAEIRAGVDAMKPAKPWISPETMQAIKGAGSDFMKKGDFVVDKIGRLGGYAAIADKAAELEAAGKGSAAEYMAKEIGKDVALEQLGKKIPGLSSLMQILDVPEMMVTEMENEMDNAMARDGSMFNAKAKSILNVIKKKTFIGTLQDILNEEGLAEVEREIANGNYSWFDVAYNTATRSVGEITQLNAIMRYGNNLKYGVYENEKAARLETAKLRNKLAVKTITKDKNLEVLRQYIIKLQMDLDIDDPIVKARVDELQKEYDQGVRDIIVLGQKMRKQFGAGDKQVEDLYKRAQIARNSQQSDLLEAKLVRCIASKDELSVEGWHEMRSIRDEYRKEVEDFRDKLKALHKVRGGSDDPLVKEMMAKYDRMREQHNAVETVKYEEVLNNQRFRENEEARKQREEELDGYAQLVKVNAQSLPPGVTVDNQALIIEIDDLMIRQGKGEIPDDADLVTLAGLNVLADMKYQALRREQLDGKIPEDADLMAMLDKELGASFDEQIDAATGGLADKINTKAPADLGAVFKGSDGETVPFQEVDYIKEVVQGVEPFTEIPPYKGQPKTDEKGGSRTQYERLGSNYNSPFNGLYKRWINGILIEETCYVNGKKQGRQRTWNASGKLETDVYYSQDKKHGYYRFYDRTTFQLRQETWYRDDVKHGPDRTYQNGKLTKEESWADGKPHGSRTEFFEDGSPRAITHYKDGKLHGPKYIFYAQEKPRSEAWYGEGTPYGWQREWTPTSLRSERLILGDRIYALERFFNSTTGKIDYETFYDTDKPGKDANGRASFPKYYRAYDAEGSIKTEKKTTADGKIFGLHIEVDSKGKRTEDTYQAPGELVSREITDADGNFIEVAYFTTDNEGTSWRHGEYSKYFPAESKFKGQKQLVANFRNGFYDGEYIDKDERTGELRRQGNYDNGRPDGEWRIGLDTLTYNKGWLEGRQVLHKKGIVERIIEIKDQKPVVIIEHFEDGKPRLERKGIFTVKPIECKIQTCEPLKGYSNVAYHFNPSWPFYPSQVYSAPLVTGDLREWYHHQDGTATVKREESYRDEKLHGKRKLYFPSGKLYVEEMISDGLLDGACRAWFDNGQQAASVSFKKGIKDGQLQYRRSRDWVQEEIQFQDGYPMGWTIGRRPDGKLETISHFIRPVKPTPNVNLVDLPANSEPQFIGHGATHPPRWGNGIRYCESCGPGLVFENDGKTVKSLGFVAFSAAGERMTTYDINTYLEWAAKDSSLPTTVPEYGQIKPLKAPEPDRPVATQAPEKPRLKTRKIVSESTTPIPQEGLDAEAAHMKMMEYWGEVNRLISAKRYQEAETMAVTSARFARAYSKTEARAVIISYEKAALAAQQAGYGGSAVVYLQQARNAASKFDQKDMIPSLDERIKALQQ
ncbi:MAG: hypothetical protein K9N55_08700 [Phycisphaerae bacterium]|nr:hypothetical protein [Phycisphaerae bacterium]